MYNKNLMSIIFIIGFGLLGATQKPQIKLKLLGEKTLDEDSYIQMALAEGKRITIAGKDNIIYYDKNGKVKTNTIFIDKNGKIIKRLKAEVRISRNGRYCGALYASMYPLGWTKNDSFVLYDSLGKKIWGITRGEDKGTIFHSRFGLFGVPPAHADIFISPDGSRVVGVEGFDAGNFSPNDTFRIDFYGEGGIIIKEVKLPHPYYWQAGWSPDGKMFVVSCPGSYPHGISRDDIVYAFDKNGKKLWKKTVKGSHFIYSAFQWAKTMVITKKFIIQGYADRILKKHGILFMDYDGNIIKKLYPPRSVFYLVLSPNERWLMAWERWDCFLVDLDDLEIVKGWRHNEFDFGKKRLIKNCIFWGKNTFGIKIGFKQSKCMMFKITKGER